MFFLSRFGVGNVILRVRWKRVSACVPPVHSALEGLAPDQRRCLIVATVHRR